MPDEANKPIDTIRLSPRDKQRLVTEIQNQSRHYTPKHDRRRLRVDFCGNVIVSLRNPDGHTVRYSVTPRNLSTHGLGFIHGQYVHQDRPCEVIIPTLNREWIQLTARIRRCKHLAKLIHDVSLVFDQPIDLADFVALTPDQVLIHHQQTGGSDEAVAGSVAAHPSQLSGTVLLAQDIPTDRKLYSVWLQRLGLKVTSIGSSQQLFDTLDSNPGDLIIVDWHVGGQSGLEIIKQLRLSKCNLPVILTSETDSDQTLAQALAAGANAVITKPLDMPTLHQITEQLLLCADDNAVRLRAGKLLSQLRDEPDMLPFIHSFVAELQGLSDMLMQARMSKDVKQMQQVCTRIKCGSASYGFAPLTRQAKLALGQMQHNSQQDQTEKVLDQLVNMLGRASAE